MTEKEEFIEGLKKRTKQFAIDVILFCNTLKTCKASSVIAYQIIKSSSSVGANYRAACRGRSKAEFFSKICIVVEEIDESEYWLEIIAATNLSDDKVELDRLTKEAIELTKIMSKAKNTSYSTK
jgi:four helix bundle protein